MTKKEWRDVMQLNNSDYKLDGNSVLKKIRDTNKNTAFSQDPGGKEAKGGPSWYADQIMVSVFIKRYIILLEY